MPPAELSLLPSPPVRPPSPMGRAGRTALWTSMILGLIGAGVCFIYKVAEFLFTMGSDEVKGFADVPVTTYFVVAAGWLFLLVWCFLTGKFNHSEQAKHDMIAREEELELLGE